MATTWTNEEKLQGQTARDWDGSDIDWDSAVYAWDGKEPTSWTNEDKEQTV